MPIYRIRRWLLKHFQDNFLIYFILSTIFAIGIIIGAITIKVLRADQIDNILVFLNSFFKAMEGNEFEGISILKQSIIDNFKTIGLVLGTGLIIIGIGIIPIVIIFRGFAIGFTVGFIVNEFGFKGFLFSILGILPQNLLIIPGIISISSIGMGLSINNLKRRNLGFRNSRYNTGIMDYLFLILFFTTIILIGTFIEAFVSSNFLSTLSNYIN
ncbi:MAG: stage II sporulation protein M [Tissierellia bacterium]|nr:stage II sporulation protein M [Tissierellia bacterium]